MTFQKRRLAFCDIEVSPNAFLIGFMNDRNEPMLFDLYGENKSFNRDTVKTIRSVMARKTLITFNGIKYDLPVMLKALDGATVKDLYNMSVDVINNNLQTWQTYQKYDIEARRDVDHIDISEVAQGVFVSLKGYASRLHAPKLQDLPYAYDKHLTPAEFEEIKKYNVNDLEVTKLLYEAVEGRVQLRYNMSEQYGVDLRSKSDAQIAEVVLVTELHRKGITATKPKPKTQIKYIAPKCIEFKTERLQRIFEGIKDTKFAVHDKTGQVILPDWLKKQKVVIGETTYQIGVGGLHSKEKKLVVEPILRTTVMRNADVASYYPSMIMEFGFYPKHLTSKFLDIYGAIKATRLKAKVGGDKDEKRKLEHELNRLERVMPNKTKAISLIKEKLYKINNYITVNEGLKIVLNGSFGKLGSKYSKLYAPDLMLQVTMTGQLMLLMLIEDMTRAGFEVVSSNTDGIEYVCPIERQVEAEMIIYDWELATGMDMEHGTYKALYARDVNNYIAVYDKEPKAKGVYAEPTLGKNSEYPIVFKAVREFLFSGKPMRDTLLECKDLTQFLTSRTVRGGGEWKGEYLGKVVRWYYGYDGDSIHYVTNGNKVPKSDGAYPMMDLTVGKNVGGIPPNLDHPKYLELAIKHLEDLGIDYG